ncbi:glycosyltransferase [Rugosimonospora acidiphila]|uniref:Glycosyltransferase n=1 Tax=Rugosimonospora acidiphila TaxID=556531 RepID=A0ABP9RQX2_9ACTN
MELTVVSTYFPLPADRGDPVRVLMMLRALSRVRGYTLSVVRRPETTGEQVARLRELLPGVEVRDFPATPYRLGRLGPAGRYPEALAAGLPPWVRTRYSAALHADLRTRTGAGLAIGEAAGAYFPGTGLRWHWDKANVLSASARQDAREAPGFVDRLRARYLTRVSGGFESRALSRAATVSVTSTEESARLARYHGRAADVTLPSCVEIPAGHLPRPRERTLVWLGSFAYRPNVLGLLRFLDEGWAALHRVGYTMTLVGSGPSAGLRHAVAAHPGVELAGYVEDLAPVLAPARAAMVPLWSGAGVKLKTLTLLAHAVPVFATPAGAEGIPPSLAVRVADSPAALAGQLLSCTAEDLDRMAHEAPRLIEREFSERRFAQRLVDALERVGVLDPTGPVPREGS